MDTSCSRRHFLRLSALAGAGLLAGAALPAPVLAVAEDAGETVTRTRMLMGTFVTMTVAQCGESRAVEALESAFELAGNLEVRYSRHNAASPLYALNERGHLDDAPEELLALLRRAQRFHSLTSGAFDMTVTPVLELFQAHRNPGGRMALDPAALRQAMELVGSDLVHLDDSALRLPCHGMKLTLDGIAKGHIVDRLSAYLRQLGLPHHLINAGGDIMAQGEKAPGRPWTVALENPDRRAPFPAVLHLRNRAVATSGSYEVFFDASREHHHLINPATGASPRQIRSVSVTAPDALQADALATALSVMPPHDAVRLIHALPGCACCLLGDRGRGLTSPGWG